MFVYKECYILVISNIIFILIRILFRISFYNYFTDILFLWNNLPFLNAFFTEPSTQTCLLVLWIILKVHFCSLINLTNFFLLLPSYLNRKDYEYVPVSETNVYLYLHVFLTAVDRRCVYDNFVWLFKTLNILIKFYEFHY